MSTSIKSINSPTKALPEGIYCTYTFLLYIILNEDIMHHVSD